MFKLSYSLPKYDMAVVQLMRDVKMGLDKLDPILGQIQTIPVSHGGTTRQVSEPKIVDTEMTNFSTVVTVESPWISETDVEKFVDFLMSLWETFAVQVKQHLIETVSKTSEAVGNVFSAEGKNIWDAQIEMIEKMEMHFNEDGTHNHQLYIPNPDTARRVAENPPTPEQQKRLEEVINAKREEYYAQKRTRRLS